MFIQSINGETRQVFLDPAAAVDGVLTIHPVDDIYKEYRTLRRTSETVRGFRSFMQAAGNVPKGGGKFTPRYLLLVSGTKLVIPDGITKVYVTGEVLTDDQTDAFDVSLVTGPTIILYQPAEAEVIKVTGGAAAAEVWDYPNGVEAGYTPRDVLRLMAAALAGKVSGAGGAQITIRDINDTKNRIVATVDSDGNRTAITLDAD